ncbi:unnamed protein product, partial [Staurois parvus]
MTQGPHDPLLPGGPMSCQSAAAFKSSLVSAPPTPLQAESPAVSSNR